MSDIKSHLRKDNGEPEEFLGGVGRRSVNGDRNESKGKKQEKSSVKNKGYYS